MKPKALIFDLDGVLVDSMPTHVRAWQEAFDNIAQVSVTDRDIYLLEGMRGMELIRKIFQERQKVADEQVVRNVNDEKNRVFKSIRRSEPFEGTVEMLDRIACAKAVVSGSAKQDVEVMLNEAFGKSKFHTVITADDIVRGKPDPGAFLEAARRLGVENPSEAVVVENAPLGAVAAGKAGMECYIALNNTPLQRSDFGNAVKAERIFETTGAVLRHLVEM